MAGLAPGGDFAGFVAKTGTGAFPHLNDEAGRLWKQLGTSGRSTFLLVNQDGTYQLTSYGQMNRQRLESMVKDLVAN